MCDFSMSIKFLDDESGQDITSVFGGKSDAIRKGSSTPTRLKSEHGASSPHNEPGQSIKIWE